jgi:hypothetical protein
MREPDLSTGIAKTRKFHPKQGAQAQDLEVYLAIRIFNSELTFLEKTSVPPREFRTLPCVRHLETFRNHICCL